MTITIGDTPLDSSHTLVFKRGIALCLRCCAFAAQAPRKLVEACAGRPHPPSKYVREVLGRISTGRTPRCGVPWALAEPADWQLLPPAGSAGAALAGSAAALIHASWPGGPAHSRGRDM